MTEKKRGLDLRRHPERLLIPLIIICTAALSYISTVNNQTNISDPDKLITSLDFDHFKQALTDLGFDIFR
jgi:hypothetical protein